MDFHTVHSQWTAVTRYTPRILFYAGLCARYKLYYSALGKYEVTSGNIISEFPQPPVVFCILPTDDVLLPVQLQPLLQVTNAQKKKIRTVMSPYFFRCGPRTTWLWNHMKLVGGWGSSRFEKQSVTTDERVILSTDRPTNRPAGTGAEKRRRAQQTERDNLFRAVGNQLAMSRRRYSYSSARQTTSVRELNANCRLERTTRSAYRTTQRTGKLTTDRAEPTRQYAMIGLPRILLLLLCPGLVQTGTSPCLQCAHWRLRGVFFIWAIRRNSKTVSSWNGIQVVKLTRLLQLLLLLRAPSVTTVSAGGVVKAEDYYSSFRSHALS